MHWVEVLVVIPLEIDYALLAEALNQIPRFCVQGDHAVSRRHEDDALIRAVGARPPGQTAPGAPPGSELASLTFVHLIHPENLTRARVQRHNRTRTARSGVEDAVYH